MVWSLDGDDDNATLTRTIHLGSLDAVTVAAVRRR